MHISDYAFYYAPGTCGNFIKVIFCYYLDDITSRRMFKLLNDDNGRTHYDDEDHPTYHYLKDVPADKRMITINYDKEDFPLINKMFYNKWWKQYALENWEEVRAQWDEIDTVSNLEEKQLIIHEQEWLEWPQKQDWDSMDLVINFKTILGHTSENLNSIIALHLDKEISPSVDQFIEAYRNKQQELYGELF